MVHRIIYTLFFSLFSLCLLAQTGSIKGTIKDAKTGDALIGATVLIDGTTSGAAADIEGNFLIAKAPAGAATLTVSYVGYQAKKINVQVESGKTTVVNTALDEDAGQALAEVVVTAERPTNTEVSLISEIKSVQQVAVGISAEQIVKTQDRDAAQIARRVPGVSIVENRFVLVRGLSQRYNTVMINDVITPSTEVDVRSFSFDMIPSNMIDRMLIFKSGAAELPGEFAGGVIKVYTKQAPEENFTNVAFSTSYRAGTSFNTVPKTEGGRLDWLGFDDGDRALPGSFPRTSQLFNGRSDQQRAGLINQLPNNWGVNNVTAPLDYRFNVNLGRRFNIGSVRIGNLTGINYSSTNQYNDVTSSFYANGDNAGETARRYDDKLFVYNSRLGILHNWSFRFNPNFLIEFKNLFNQLGFSETLNRSGAYVAGENREEQSYSQRFESRSIYSGQLVGKNSFNDGRTDLNWQLGLGYTRRTEPDWRRLVYFREAGSDQPFSAAISGQPVLMYGGRFFSELDETALTAAAGVEHKLGPADKEDPIKLKAGFYTERKDREFSARFFGYVNGTAEDKALPVGEMFSPERVTGEGNFTAVEDTKPTDTYTAANTLLAGYASAYLPIGDKFSATLGLRVESNQQELSSRDGSGPVKVDNLVVSPLPSANLVYNLSDKQLLRVAYAYTVNRPEFRELAPFNYFDFALNADIIGNRKLTTAKIQNVDARWEYYPSPSELISFGAFYKHFRNPVENLLREGSLISYTFINAEEATSYGVEAEIRKSFSELSSSRFIQNLTFVGNASYIISNVNLGRFTVVDPLVNPEPLEVGALVDQNRPLQNQSPYLINGGFYYSDDQLGLQVNALYNIFGKRLFAVGTIANPSIYEMPRGVLDLNITKSLGQKFELRLNFQDLLNQRVRLEQDFNRDGKITGSDRQTVRSLRRGQYFTLGVVYNFNRKTQTPTSN
jgi:outer membrane receptor protein involved in Fe transport